MDSSDVLTLIAGCINSTDNESVATTQIGEDGPEIKLITWDKNNNCQVWIINVKEFIGVSEKGE